RPESGWEPGLLPGQGSAGHALRRRSNFHFNKRVKRCRITHGLVREGSLGNRHALELWLLMGSGGNKITAIKARFHLSTGPPSSDSELRRRQVSCSWWCSRAAVFPKAWMLVRNPFRLTPQSRNGFRW